MRISKELLKKIKSKKFSIKDFDINEVGKNIKDFLYSPYLYLLLGLLCGFLLTIQFKTESSRPLNPVLFYGQLNDVKNNYMERNNDLNAQIKQVQEEIKEKESTLNDRKIISGSLFDAINNQELVFGNSAVSGQGVVITISDGEEQTKDEFSKSLTHAADLRDIVNLLWYSGAEAISINNERIIYNTSIDCIVSTIMINNNNYVPPFVVRAIGNKSDLLGVLNNSRKLEGIKKRAAKKQINLNIESANEVKIERYSGAYSKI